jgi:hypothetical protein
MFPRLGKWLVVLALVSTTGGHWFLLQSIAWVTMAVNFAQTDPLMVALTKTFDGKHPCKICKSVEQGRGSEQKQTVLKIETKLEFCLNREPVALPLPPLLKQFTSFDSLPSSRSEAPPTPPPRLA